MDKHTVLLEVPPETTELIYPKSEDVVAVMSSEAILQDSKAPVSEEKHLKTLTF